MKIEPGSMLQMAEMGDARAMRYRAFISYSRKDKAFARRLQKRLEAYRLPRRLRGTVPMGAPRRLGTVFLDELGFAAAPDLSEAIKSALRESEFLIVVCSAAAAASSWVGLEIAFFNGLHGPDRTLAALVDGAPPAVFHAALRATDETGATHEPLAADFRDGGDGFRPALLKLVAALARLRLDDLVQRDAQQRVRHVMLLSAVAVSVMAMVSTLGTIAMTARLAARAERKRSWLILKDEMGPVHSQLEEEGRHDVLRLLYLTIEHYFSGQNTTSMTTEQLQQLATFLNTQGEDDEKRDDFAKAQAEFERAWKITAALLAAQPNNPGLIYDHAQNEYWVGFINWRLENYGEAEARFEAYAALAHRLVQIDPGNPDWLIEAGYAESDLGTFILRRSIDLVRAEPLFEATRASYQAADRRRPGGMDTQLAIADSYSWLADVQRLRGNYDAAVALRDQQRTILEVLQARQPSNALVREQLNSTQLAMARIDVARGAYDRAIDTLSAGRSVADELVRNDQDNRGLVREARMFALFEAKTWMIMPASARPKDDSLRAALGNCDSDGLLPHNGEIVTYCMIQRARYMALSGHVSGAKDALAAAERRANAEGDRLTERFGLDLRAETFEARAAIQQEALR